MNKSPQTSSRALQSRLHAFFRQLSEADDTAVWLGGSAEGSALNRWALMGLRPRQLLVLQGDCLTRSGRTIPVGSADHLMAELEAVRQGCRRWEITGLPFNGGLAGVLAYDFHRWCDPVWQTGPMPMRETPSMVLCEFEDWLLIDLETGCLHVLSEDAGRIRIYGQAWESAREMPLPETGPSEAMEAYLQTLSASFDPQGFADTVDVLKKEIRQGEIYQANLSIRFEKTACLDPHDAFARMCERNPSPFSGFFKWPGGMILSNSPERLIQTDKYGKAQTRPIAGTRGRGRDATEDEAIGQTLLLNEKERAEHLMLVDLERNDLGRVCEAGSVAVDELLVLERYAHVTHLVSNVTGRLRQDVSPWQVLQAVFPGGTITGCPKIRCMEILSRLEPVSRGFYTGGMGYIDAATGAMDWNILIRSMFLTPAGALKPAGTLRYNTAIHAGAGIVYDSVGAHEYRECLRKATTLLQVLQSVERNCP